MENFHSQMPIIAKTYELYKTFYQYLLLFPKRDKYTLGSKCENYIISVLELLLAAGSATKEKKLLIIQQASVKFDALKIFIRLAKDLKCLDNKKYTSLEGYLQEIGKMLGGWQKSLA
jgi:hypothetical protein